MLSFAKRFVKSRRDFGPFSLRLNPRLPGISSQLLKHGRREEAFMLLMKQEVEPGMVALDIGANIGYTTMTLASLVGPDGKVFAIEPDSRNLASLRENVELNRASSVVSIYQCAVSDYDGDGTLYMAKRSNLNCLAPTPHTTRSATRNVPVVTLDSFFRDKPLPNFMKMDIEGLEVEVLKGFERTVQESNFLLRILMEVHPRAYTDTHSLREILKRYFDLGFHCKHLISAGSPRPEPIVARGYEPAQIPEMIGRHQRAIYTGIPDDDALDFACYFQSGKKLVRALLIERKG